MKKLRKSPSIDKLPPHDVDVEQATIGCLLLAPNEGLHECIAKFGSDLYEVFYDLRNQTIFNALVEIKDQGTAIDIVALCSWLKSRGVLEEVGGLAYLSELPDKAPSAANLPSYVEILLEKYKLRKTVHVCTGIVSQIFENEGSNADEMLDLAERDILDIRKFSVTADKRTMADLMKESINTIEDYHNRRGITGLATGFPDLDKVTGGFQRSEMIVLAARPSLGKTSLAMNISEYVATEIGVPVGVFSLEMKKETLALRMLCSRARVNLRNIREGFLAERDFPKLVNAAGKLSRIPLHIDDTSSLSIMQLRARARRLQQMHGIKLFVVDYLQLLHAMIGGKRIDKREREVAEISAGIKDLAKELDVPVIVLCQMNREFEREKRKPRMSDLRESGAIEQDADTICFLYRRSKEEDDDTPQDTEAIAVNLLIGKQRNGASGDDIRLTFLRGYTRFESASKISDEDVYQQDMHYQSPTADP